MSIKRHSWYLTRNLSILISDSMPQVLPQNMLDSIRDYFYRLTPKGRILGDFIIHYPRKAVFMTTKELAEACNVSEATVVRFVNQLHYKGYAAFQQALRDFVDSELSLLERAKLPGVLDQGSDRLSRVIYDEMDNLNHFLETIDRTRLDEALTLLDKSNSVYVIGSRLSYASAYFLGWSLTKIRSGIQVIKGSDSASVDWLNLAPKNSLVVIVATTRYPNELIRLGKVVKKLGHTLLAIVDGPLCPLIQFSQVSIIAPSKNIPFIGSTTTISCVINYLVMSLASRQGSKTRQHQEKLEQLYRENDILYNMQ